jgi:hypothetical protein
VVERTVVVVVPVGMGKQLHAEEITTEAVYFEKQEGFGLGGLFFPLRIILVPPPGGPQIADIVATSV